MPYEMCVWTVKIYIHLKSGNFVDEYLLVHLSFADPIPTKKNDTKKKITLKSNVITIVPKNFPNHPFSLNCFVDSKWSNLTNAQQYNACTYGRTRKHINSVPHRKLCTLVLLLLLFICVSAWARAHALLCSQCIRQHAIEINGREDIASKHFVVDINLMSLCTE